MGETSGEGRKLSQPDIMDPDPRTVTMRPTKDDNTGGLEYPC